MISFSFATGVLHENFPILFSFASSNYYLNLPYLPPYINVEVNFIGLV
jgi:hypothetical protein